MSAHKCHDRRQERRERRRHREGTRTCETFPIKLHRYIVLPLPTCTYLFQLRKYLLRSLKVEEKKNNFLVNFYKHLLYSTYIELIYFVNIFLNVTQNMQITNKKVKLGFRQQQHSKAFKKKGRVNKSLGKMWKPPTESIQIKNHLSEVKCSREKCFLPDKKKG